MKKTALLTIPPIQPLYYILTSVICVLTSAQYEHLSFLALFWLIPFGLALKNLTPIQSVKTACVCATAFWAGSIWWITPATINFTHANNWAIIAMYLGLCIYMALPYCLFAFFYSYFKLHTIKKGAYISAALITTLLILIPTPIPGLPLHALHPHPKLLATLDISGISSLVFITSLFQFIIVNAIQANNKNIRDFMHAFLIFIFIYAYGQHYAYQYNIEKKRAPKHQWINIGIIQPNLRRNDNTDTLYSLTQNLILSNANIDLIVWPEFPPAYSVIENQNDKEKTLNLSQEFQQDLLVVSGYVYKKINSIKYKKQYYNAINLVKNGAITSSYYKQRLVPFFEYLPGRSLLPNIEHWFPGSLNYIPGSSSEPIIYNENIKIIPSICYEAIFPDIINKFVRNNGNILINTVSDTWFENTPGSQYHFSLAYFRAIEHRIPWVRAANSGISITVEANGEVLPHSKTAQNTVATSQQHIFIPKKRSLYSRNGDWLTPILVILILIFSLKHIIQNHNTRKIII
jgi:apolipoprotein N-acyltransferase